MLQDFQQRLGLAQVVRRESFVMRGNAHAVVSQVGELDARADTRLLSQMVLVLLLPHPPVPIAGPGHVSDFQQQIRDGFAEHAAHLRSGYVGILQHVVHQRRGNDVGVVGALRDDAGHALAMDDHILILARLVAMSAHGEALGEERDFWKFNPHSEVYNFITAISA